MIHDLKPYLAHKDSGVPWLGKKPEPLGEAEALSDIAEDATDDIDAAPEEVEA